MAPIKQISDIDTSTINGRMLVAAITIISSESVSPRSYDQVISECTELAEAMYGKLPQPKPEPAY